MKNFDYSENGLYFVTICTAEHKETLSSVHVGRGLAPAEVRLTSFGKIAREQILGMPKHYPCVGIEKFVIMPNHIHLLVFIDGFAAGASPRPTLSQIICSFKSLTTRRIKNEFPKVSKVWQTSFYDHIIRNEKDYIKHLEYIDDNPVMWAENRHEI